MLQSCDMVMMQPMSVLLMALLFLLPKIITLHGGLEQGELKFFFFSLKIALG